MKNRIIKISALVTLTLAIVAWSPPSSDDLIVGDTNTYTSPGGYLAIVGNGNELNAKHSMVVGQSNSVPARTSPGPTTSTTFVSGYNNSVTGSSTVGAFAAVALGEGNAITTLDGGYAIGLNNSVTATDAVAIGTGTKANTANGTALGRYNATMASDDVLVVGTGTSTATANRNTALRVTADGGVILGRAQGDISMGAYAN